MAGIFRNYRSEHHPDANIRIPLAIQYLRDEVEIGDVQEILKRRDRWMWLEMESSSVAGILIEAMVEACPEKRFIHTIRDPFSWADSWFDHNINSPPKASSPSAQLDRVRLRADEFPPTKYDRPLIERGLPSLASHFQLWRTHNAKILETIPKNKVLVVETHKIIEMVPKIADWVGVPPETLEPKRGWLFSAPMKHGLLQMLDPIYVQETAEQFCGSLVRQLFPDGLRQWPGRPHLQCRP